MENNDNLFGSICLTDIPKELIRTAENGKKYLTVVINRRREPGKFGHTHYIKAYCRKDEQKEGVNYYIGELKPGQQQGQPTAAQPQQTAAPAQDEQSPWAQPLQQDDLPF